MNEKATPKPINFEDSEKIYDRLCGLENDLKSHLEYTHVSNKEYNTMYNVMISLQSLINQVYIASHTGKDAK